MVPFALPHIVPQQLKHAVKTGLAALIAYVIVVLLHLAEGQWAVISVVVVMQTSLGSSLKTGWNRIIGTAFGAAVGVVCLAAFGVHPVTLGVTLALTTCICAYFVNKHDAFRMAGLTACIVLLGAPGHDYAVYGFVRFFEISIGVGVALAVSFFIWPARAGRELKIGVALALRQEADFFQALSNCRFPTDCDPKTEKSAKVSLDKTREHNHHLLEQARAEPAGFTSEEHIVVSLYNFVERIAEHLLAMEHAVHFQQLEPLHGQVLEAMDHLTHTTINAMNSLALALECNTPPAPAPDLNLAVKAAESALAKLRRQRTLSGFNLETVLRFMSYYYNMKEVATELAGMYERAEMLPKR